MAVNLLLPLLAFVCGSCSWAQILSDAEIQEAIDRGRSTTPQALWQELRNLDETLITRGSFGAPIELRVIIVTGGARIALEAAEAQRQLREISADDAKKLLGVTGVLLEARSSGAQAGFLHPWAVQGGVHMVFKIGGKIVQPLQKQDGEGFYVYPSGGSLLKAIFSNFAYTSAYFTFPEIPKGVQSVIVTVIPGSGKTREKEIAIR
jgi:hypothetical protein